MGASSLSGAQQRKARKGTRTRPGVSPPIRKWVPVAARAVDTPQAPGADLRSSVLQQVQLHGRAAHTTRKGNQLRRGHCRAA